MNEWTNEWTYFKKNKNKYLINYLMNEWIIN